MNKHDRPICDYNWVIIFEFVNYVERAERKPKVWVQSSFLAMNYRVRLASQMNRFSSPVCILVNFKAFKYLLILKHTNTRLNGVQKETPDSRLRDSGTPIRFGWDSIQTPSRLRLCLDLTRHQDFVWCLESKTPRAQGSKLSQTKISNACKCSKLGENGLFSIICLKS